MNFIKYKRLILLKFPNNKYLTRDMIIIFLIISLPFMFFVYNFVPKGISMWSNKWITIKSNNYEDVNFFLWIFSVKILTLAIISIWFITCKYWWRFFIIFPILSEFHKLNTLIKNDKVGFYSEIDFFDSLFYSVPYIIIIIFLSKILGYRKGKNEYFNLVNNEINEQVVKLSKFDNKNYKLVKSQLFELQTRKHEIDKKEYLRILISLRDKLNLDV